MYRIEYSTYSHENFINEVLYLDSLVYPEEFQGDYDSVYKRFLKNNKSFVLLYDDNKLIGYICLFPASNILFKKIIDGKVKEDGFLDCEYVLPYRFNKQHNLHIISMVLHPDYQGRGLIKYLLNGLYKHLAELKDSGFRIEFLTAVSISKKGRAVLQNIGFDVVNIIDKDIDVLKSSFNNIIDKLAKMNQ